MNPSTGTFTTMDTYQGSIFDPVSLHKYLYANANPVTYVDPSGFNSADLNEELTAMALDGGIEEIFKPAVSFALNYYWQFRAAIPAIATAVTGMAAVLFNSPVFTDICSQLASGSMTVSDIQQQIIDTFVSINPTIWDNIFQAVNRSGGSLTPSNNSGGGAGSSGMPDPNQFNWRDKLLKMAQNSKLKNIIDQLYRWNARTGDGGTADKLREEAINGEHLKHLQKAQDKIIEITRLLNDPTLSVSDRKLAYQLLNDLYEAVKVATK